MSHQPDNLPDVGVLIFDDVEVLDFCEYDWVNRDNVLKQCVR